MTSIILVMTIMSLVDGPWMLSLRLEVHLLHPYVGVLLGSPMLRYAYAHSRVISPLICLIILSYHCLWHICIYLDVHLQICMLITLAD